MADLIDRESAITAMIDLNKEDLETYSVDIPEGFNEYHLERAIKKLKLIPAVDIVDVVRCKDCKWYQKRYNTYYSCCNWDANMQADDFCSEGERRNNDNLGTDQENRITTI